MVVGQTEIHSLMQHLLEGKSLVWLSVDELGVFTAATHKMLSDHFVKQPIKVQLIRAGSPDELSQFAARQTAGLVTFVVRQASELPAVCKSLARIRGRVEQPLCACFVTTDMIEQVGLLLEAGAQTIVSRLDVWQRTLPRILARAPLSTLGFHPLTAGLVERLPWKSTGMP